MAPSLALALWFVLLAALLWRDPAIEKKTSIGSWVPVAWMVIAGSRLPSQWLGLGGGQSAQAMQEGSPIDRLVYTALIFVMIGTLVSRSFKWSEFLQKNRALAAFLCFGLLSMVWSDYSFIALKRWFRDFGDYATVLVLLTDPRPLDAVRIALRRLCYLLVPLSIVLIKYFPQASIHYEIWSGLPEYVGVATSKNTLGAICLISGVVFLWDTATRWGDRKARRTKKILAVNGVFLAMSIWLLQLSNSATSRVCLILGCLVILAVSSKWGNRHRGIVKFVMPASFLAYVVMTLAFSMNDQIAGLLGRNANLTGRTDIWKVLLAAHTNPIVGTGYENFWLGPRLQWVWEQSGGINEAHNGYLDTYLNLGYVGLAILLLILISGYITICRRLDRGSDLARLGAAIWTLLLFYNVTEAAFMNGLLWMAFLLGAVVVPLRVGARPMVRSNSELGEPAPTLQAAEV